MTWCFFVFCFFNQWSMLFASQTSQDSAKSNDNMVQNRPKQQTVETLLHKKNKYHVLINIRKNVFMILQSEKNG